MKHLLTICAVILLLGSTTNAVTWNVPGDFATIQDANDSPSVVAGDTILVGTGNHAGAYISKAIEIKGEDGAVINDGPLHPAGLTMGFRLLAGSDGATINHLGFTVDFPVMNGAGVADVTVDHCTMTSPVQGVSNWEGNGWNISHNVINGLRTRSGGGIGIFIGCLNGSTANNSLVAHNKIIGEVLVPYSDCGGYSTPGIALMSDRRWNRDGGTISGNRIIKNKISLSLVVLDPEPDDLLNPPDPMECVGIELTDMGLEQQEMPAADLKGNKVGFNDVRGVVGVPIALNPDPEKVAEENPVSRNLGDDTNNRGHGLHPNVLLK